MPASHLSVVMETSLGTIKIELNEEKAPITVKNFLAYVDESFYDNTIFHRVIDGFMIQGGGFEPGMNQKRTKASIKNESSNGLSNALGAIAMARTNDPDNCATAQFYINVADNSGSLDQPRVLRLFGKVTEGLDVVDKKIIGRQDRQQGRPRRRAVARRGHQVGKTCVKGLPLAVSREAASGAIVSEAIMGTGRVTWGVVAVATLALSAGAQQPAPKAPTYPAINPAQARADGIAGGLDGPAFGVAWNEDRGLLVVACENQSLCYWRKDVALGVRSADLPASIVRGGHTGPVTAVVAAGPVFASGGFDGKVVLWDLPADKVLHTLTAGGPVRALAAAPDGKTLASAGDDAVVQLWDVPAGKAGRCSSTGAGDWHCCRRLSARTVSWSPPERSTATGFCGTWLPAKRRSIFLLLLHRRQSNRRQNRPRSPPSPSAPTARHSPPVPPMDKSICSTSPTASSSAC